MINTIYHLVPDFSSGYINATLLYGEIAGANVFHPLRLSVLRAHGILAVIAWVLCGAIATTLSRYEIQSTIYIILL